MQWKNTLFTTTELSSAGKTKMVYARFPCTAVLIIMRSFLTRIDLKSVPHNAA